jgi:signal transduction histidine kinase
MGRADLQLLESRYAITRPRIAMSKAIQQEWRDYTEALSNLSTGTFQPTRELIDSIIGEEAAKARIEIDRRLRVETALEELAEQAKRRTKDGSASAKKEADRVAAEVRTVTSACISEVEAELRTVVSEFQRTDLSHLSDKDFLKTRDMLESRILKVAEDRSCLLESIVTQLESIELSGETSTLDQLVAVEQRNVILEEEAEADLQLAQLGMAVEVINHEFNATIRSLRKNLRRLKAWADINEDFEGLYQNIRASFDHLDGYLTLFTPLQRRLQRQAVEIRGLDIHDFLRDLFQERLRRHNISMVQTQAFSGKRLYGFPSSFYPVFVNLVDNSIYWLSQMNQSEERKIVLDSTDTAIVVSDSGPGIDTRDREAIFEFGFTRKPGGRGMGLHISRQVLNRVGYDLSLSNQIKNKGATFVLRPVNSEAKEGNNSE